VAAHESLAELSAQLAEVRTLVAQFGARLDTETGPVIVLQTEVKRLRAKVDDIAAKLDAAKSAKGTEGDEPSAPRWDSLSPDLEADQLGELHIWVETVLRVQYPGYLRHLPPCWATHREALWELGTLHAEWTRVYAADEPPLADAQWWHERWLPGALNRLRSITCDNAGCSLQRRVPNGHVASRLNPLAAASFPGQPRPRP
jgi:hypothetical protein